jgi:polar amino acid transport system substrate-binding protein
MRRYLLRFLLLPMLLGTNFDVYASDAPACPGRLTLALHDRGLLYSSATNTGIDRDFADELIRRSGCQVSVSVMPRARIWQLIESGALDFSLSGIGSEARHQFAGFAWYFSNKYYLLVRRDAGVDSLAAFARNPALMLGGVRSFRYSSNLNRLIDRLEAEQRIEYSTHLEPLYELLAKKRIHGMIVEPFDYPEVEEAVLRAITTTIDSGDPPTPHGLIMSKKSIPPPEQDKWHALVSAMRADGTVLRIFEKYFSPALARSMVNF